jgi:hypothetical protein
VTFDALASIAAVGTGQRSSLPPAGAPSAYLPGTDENDPQALAYALLDSAAALAVVRRGTPLAAPGDPVAPAPDDALPEPPQHVVSLLGPLLADDAGAIRLASDRAYVLAEALGLVARAGMRLPHRLLGAALARRDLRPFVRPVLGARGEWLLAQLQAAGLDGTQTTAADPSDAELWDSGTSDERLAWFRHARTVDPDGAREAAAAVWKDSPAAFRAELMAAVAATVNPADEAFCEAGLDDRGEGVRVAAAEALSRLPGSAFVARMAVRAQASIAVGELEPGALHRLLKRTIRTLRVTPYEADEAAVRDGLGRKLSSAERLTRLVAAIPPSTWPSLIGATAAELVTLHQDEPRWELVGALGTATLRNADAATANVLVAAGVKDVRLVPLLAPAAVVALIAQVPATLLGTALERVPTPWPQEVATAVGQQLIGPKSHEVRPEVWTLFSRAVPLRVAGGWAQRLRGLGQPEGRTVRNMLRDTVSVLTVRALFADELRPFLPETSWQDTQPGGQP